MWTSLGIAWREIRNHASFSLFFALNLALGFAGALVRGLALSIGAWLGGFGGLGGGSRRRVSARAGHEG